MLLPVPVLRSVLYCSPGFINEIATCMSLALLDELLLYICFTIKELNMNIATDEEYILKMELYHIWCKSGNSGIHMKYDTLYLAKH